MKKAELEKRIKRVLKLHRPTSWPGYAERICTHCNTWYPCTTVRILEPKAK